MMRLLRSSSGRRAFEKRVSVSLFFKKEIKTANSAQTLLTRKGTVDQIRAIGYHVFDRSSGSSPFSIVSVKLVLLYVPKHQVNRL